MRVETNTALAKRNRRIANLLFLFSMGVLIGGFVIANSQAAVTKDATTVGLAFFLPWLVLPIGLITTIASVRMTNLWIRRPYPEDAIQQGLKGMSKRSVLYNYYHFPARHVLVAPQGTFAIITRFQDGKFTVNGDKWGSNSGVLGGVTRVFRQDGIGNPTQDANKAAAHLKSMLSKTLPDVEVQPLIIFVDPRAQLEIKDPTVPVLFASEDKEPSLRSYLREIAQQQEKQIQPQSKKKPGDKSKPETTKGPTPEEIADALETVTVV